MTAQELLKAGRLREAVAAQTEEVKAHPADPDRRLVLFTVLCFAGELERAQVHLQAAALSDDGMRGGASVYHGLVAAEYERRKVYREGARPVLPPDPPPSLELRLEALAALHKGDVAAAGSALERAAEQAVELRGKLNGEGFDGLRDYDDLLGQVLEVYAGGRCLWLPMERIRRLEIAAPDHQLDLLWAQAELEDTDGEQASVYLPALYEGSADHGEDAVRLGRSTEWVDQGESLYRGAGQKVLFAVQGEQEREVGLLEVRTLELESPPADSAG